MEIPHRSARRLARGAVLTVCLLFAFACSADGAWDVIRELQGVFTPSEDTPWLDPAFQHRHYLVFDNSAATEDLVDFPVLVTLTPDRVDYSAMPDESSTHIRFTDSDGQTLLDHEVNTWSFGGVSTIWVKVPRIGAGSHRGSIWLYYGNPGTGPVANEPRNVWDGGFRRVWHLGGLQDSTSYENDGITPTTSIVAPVLIPAMIGNGRSFNGSSFINMGDCASLRITDNLTLEAWVFRRVEGYQAILGKYAYTGDARSYLLGFDYRENLYPGDGPCAVMSDDGTFTESGLVQDPVSHQLSTWQHIVAVFRSGHLRLYVNGIKKAQTFPVFDLHNNTEPVIIGACDNGSNLRFDGVLDEVRISAAARSDSWIRGQYLSMTDALITYGPRQTR